MLLTQFMLRISTLTIVLQFNRINIMDITFRVSVISRRTHVALMFQLDDLPNSYIISTFSGLAVTP